MERIAVNDIIRPPLQGEGGGGDGVKYAYDPLGRITQKTQTQGARTWNVHYQYNNAGQLESLTYPSGTKVSYAYSNGKLTSVKLNNQPLLNNIGFEPFGPINGWTWASGATYKKTYDENGRITKTTLPDLPAAYHQFDYDNLNRLTRAETIGAFDNTVTLYGYDATGNRTGKTTNGETFAYINERQSNRLLRVEGAANLVLDAFTYDAVGSTVSHVATNATNGASNANDFVYDARGRLIQANTTLYKINALEQRIEKQGFGADTPSGTRHFVYDEAGHLIGEYDPISGNPMIEHVWLEGAPVAAIKNGSVFYVYPDHLGTPRAITDTTNQTVWYWNYDEPFGATEANENPNGTGTFTYNLRFPGQYFDSETGLHYNGHRDYNSATGKYIQSDPIGLEGGLNTYAYVEGNPLNLSDPTGLAAAIPVPVPICLTPAGAVICGGITFCILFPEKCAGVIGGVMDFASRNFTCSVRCNVYQVNHCAPCPERVTGFGTGLTKQLACKAAEKDANSKVPGGCQKRHCHEIGRRRD